MERGDTQDPRPWLEAFDAGVGSPLELAFLRLFVANGIAVKKQYPVSADEGWPVISIADFAILARKIAVYVDGAAFHSGSRLRRDRRVRDRLSMGSCGWRVVALASKDWDRFDALSSQFR
jgi:very-short-patch-repair endonuclease